MSLIVASRLLEGLNPEQAQAVEAPLESAVQVLAGAGTGKTELITRRYVALALQLQAQGVSDPAERLWVSTFTEKAATEMRERITAMVNRETGVTLSSKAWIGTFHSLCQRILREQADLLPHLRGAALLTALDEELFRESLLAEMLQRSFWQRPMAVAAGFDRTLRELESLGRLETLLTEVLYRIIPQIKSAGWSAETFLAQALAQTTAFRHALSSMPAYLPDGVMDSHDAFARAWSRHLQAWGQPGLTFLHDVWEQEVEAEKQRAKGKDAETPEKLLEKRLKPLYKLGCYVTYNGRKKLPFSSGHGDFGMLAEALCQEEALIRLVHLVHRTYQERLRDQHLLDFDDLIHETVALMAAHPDVAGVYRQRFAHFMVDEFQDSNGAQLALIRAMTTPESPCLTVVGDKKQSIYGFRYAEPENLEAVFDPAAPPPARIVLMRNYRSHPDILCVANRLTEMMSLPAKERLQSALSVEASDSPSVTWLTINTDEGIAAARATEVAWITQTVAGMLTQGSAAPQEIAVLVRDHVKALQLEAAFDALSIPSVKQRNLGFFRHPVIRQAMAFLLLNENPDDDLSLIAVLQDRLPQRLLYTLAQTRRQLQQAMGQRHLSLIDTLANTLQQTDMLPETLLPYRSLLHYLVTTIHKLHEQRAMLRPQHIFNLMLEAFPLLSSSDLESLGGRKALKQLALLQRLLYYWAEGRPRQPLTFGDILDRLRRYRDKDDLDVPVGDEAFFESAVRILTIHGSKGLEFPVVFVAGVGTYRSGGQTGLVTVDPQYAGKPGFGLFLNKWAGNKSAKRLVYDAIWRTPRNRAEELRLYYVAVTRARQRLFLSTCDKGFPYLNPRFFNDLPVHWQEESDIGWLSPETQAAMAEDFRARYVATEVERAERSGTPDEPALSQAGAALARP